MSQQPTSIGTTLASLGTNARVITGLAGLAMGVLATGTAVTVASGGSDPAVASHAAAPTGADQPAAGGATPTDPPAAYPSAKVNRIRRSTSRSMAT